jgi:AcrR family transcriptional regulator
MKPETNEAAAEDHRVKAGAQRREKTRLRLLESALKVFTEKGPGLAVIDDFIAAAGVSRGSFYNHFRTTGELLLALASAMSDEVLQIVDPLVLQQADPVVRFSTGLQMALRDPQWGAFISQVGPRVAARGQLIDTYLMRDLGEAIRRKRIRAPHLLVARDLVLGSIFYGIETMLVEPTHASHPEQMAQCILLGLGLPEAEAKEIAWLPLPVPGEVQGPIFSRLQPGRRHRSTVRAAAPGGAIRSRQVGPSSVVEPGLCYFPPPTSTYLSRCACAQPFITARLRCTASDPMTKRLVAEAALPAGTSLVMVPSKEGWLDSITSTPCARARSFMRCVAST